MRGLAKRSTRGNDQAVNSQGLHECQGQQQHTSQVICHLRLTGDAVNASSGSNALAKHRKPIAAKPMAKPAPMADRAGIHTEPSSANAACGVTKVAAVKAAAVPVCAEGADT